MSLTPPPSQHRLRLHTLKLCFGLLSLCGAQPPDTLYIAWPCTLSPSLAGLLPHAERLTELPDGRYVVRYWETPQSWPSPDNPTLIAIFPALPDSGYPKPDFTIPQLPAPHPPENPPSLLWPLLLALLLSVVLFHRPLGRLLRETFHRLYWRLRWEAFLWKYPPHHPMPLPTYAQALFELLLPYCDFHPGSLLPSETTRLTGPEPLCRLLHLLLPPLYEERFLQKPIPPPNQHKLHQQLQALLKQARPYVSTPHRHRLHLCPSS